MDKKLTFTGGEPNLNIDDLLRDPIANRAALFGLMLGLGVTTDCLISGAVVTINTLVDASVTAGYVWLNGEILQVDAATVTETQGTDLWEFQKVVSYDSNGDKTFNDGTPRQTWQKNRAVLVNVATVTGFDAVNASSLLATVVNNQKASQSEVEAGAVDDKIVTPAKLIALQATETQKGLAEVATQTETNTGTDDGKMVTPAKLPGYVASRIGVELFKDVEVLGSTIVTQTGPGAVSLTTTGTGGYELTHNIGDTNYIIIVYHATLAPVNATSWVVGRGDNVASLKSYNGTTLANATQWRVTVLKITYS